MKVERIRTNWIGKIFGNITHLEFNDSEFSILSNDEIIKQYQWSDISLYPEIRKGLLGSKIIINHKSPPETLNFLKAIDVEKNKLKLTRFVSNAIKQKVRESKEKFLKFAVNEYLRDSNFKNLEQLISPILTGYQAQTLKWDSTLQADEIQFLKSVAGYFPIASGAKALRQEFEQRLLENRQHFYKKVESNPLTLEQKLAIIRDNDRNLVLAAAGTGKTSVIIAKALDLIDRNICKPEHILILAYNKSAAIELRERLKARSSNLNSMGEVDLDIMTFHALGLGILSDAKEPVRISKFSDDPIKLEMWLSKWFSERLITDEEFMKTFIDLSHQPINPFEFKSKEEYDAYVRDNDYRTLQGERVRGYQELLIANWFFLNGIEYEYEPRYVSKRRIEIGFDYSPDFYIKSADVYLEHFGIARNGNTRPDIDSIKYNQSIASKRALHAECGTRLIETYHYNWTENNLEAVLEQHIQALKIPINKRHPTEVFRQLKESGFLLNGIKRYLKCLQAIRVEQISDDEIYERLSEQKIVNADKYQKLLGDIHLAYKEELKQQISIDFDDMIIRASLAIKNDLYAPHWTHLLVDEFQDISGSRMQFLQKIIEKGNNPRLTVVGDDWQSIYRFAGGKLELTTQFENRIGSCSITKLQKTFRYNDSIADTAGKFVMQNPEQYQKKVVTNTKVNSSQVYLLDSMVGNEDNLALRTVQIVTTILKKDPQASIAILARYRYLLIDAKNEFSKYNLGNNIKFWTFHGSKGLEADYCVLIGFFQGKTGFPNESKEEVVVEALLPNLDSFPHSEERRLLYVGITRARKKSYLIADPMAPSQFIVELLSPHYGLHIASKTFEKQYRAIFKCNSCSTGHYKLRKGKFGEFYSCTSGEVCNSKPRICNKCGSPSIDGVDSSKCNNINCGEMTKICNICGRPMKKRKGKYGEFWGCTGYGIKDDQCRNTSKTSSFLGMKFS